MAQAPPPSATLPFTTPTGLGITSITSTDPTKTRLGLPIHSAENSNGSLPTQTQPSTGVDTRTVTGKGPTSRADGLVAPASQLQSFTVSPVTTGTVDQEPTNVTDSSSQHHSELEQQTSRDSRMAMIISSITLGLVVILVASLAIWFCVVRRRRATRTKTSPTQFTGSQIEPMQTAGDEEEGRRSTAAAGVMIRAGGGREMGEARVSFNPANMVVPRYVVTSMAESQTGSQVTTITNPPPPYGNGNPRGSGRSDSVPPGSPDANRNAIETAGSAGPLRPETVVHLHPAETTARAGSLGVTPSITVERPSLVGTPSPVPAGGGQLPYDILSVPSFLSSPLTVQYTFTPASGDELEVKKGDQLQIVGVFDDGWCLCKTEAGSRGVVPLACFNVIDGTELGGENRVGVDTAEERIENGDREGSRESGEDGDEERVIRRSIRVESRNVSVTQAAGSNGPQNSVRFPGAG